MHTQTEIVGNMHTAQTFLDNNPEIKEVRMLPNVLKQQEAYRPQFYPQGMTPRGKNSNADAVITWKNGNEWVSDFKDMQGKGGKIVERLNESYEQADYAIIRLSESLTPDLIEKINRWFKQHTKMKGIIIYCNGMEVYHIER
jgi:hypothetical protein